MSDTPPLLKAARASATGIGQGQSVQGQPTRKTPHDPADGPQAATVLSTSGGGPPRPDLTRFQSDSFRTIREGLSRTRPLTYRPDPTALPKFKGKNALPTRFAQSGGGGGGGGGGSSYIPRGTPATRLKESLPTRTSKAAAKFVSLPEEVQDRPPESEILPFGVVREDDGRTVAERLSKKERGDYGLPRLTSYAVSEYFKMKSLGTFLSRSHAVRPRQYDEVIYAAYQLPLVPHPSRSRTGPTVQSSPATKSPGGGSIFDRQLEEYERRDYEAGYFEQRTLSTAHNESGEAESHERAQDGSDHGVGNGGSGQDEEREREREREGGFYEIEGGAGIQVGDRLADLLEDETKSTLDSSRKSRARPPTRKQIRRKASMTDAVNLKVGEALFFQYGVVIFFNFSRSDEQAILKDMTNAGITVRPLSKEAIEDSTEQFHFEYNSSLSAPRIFNDMLTLRTHNHMLKVAISHAIAQSAKLSIYEDIADKEMEVTRGTPKQIAQTGELGLNRKQALKMSGRLFKLRVGVNLVGKALDVPELMWDEPSLRPLYDAFRSYLEIRPRVEVLNERCAVVGDLLDLIHESHADSAMERITLIIIWLIVVACFVEMGEVMARLVLHYRNNA